MAVDVSWPGFLDSFTMEDKDGKTVPDESKIYLLNSVIHEIVDRLADLNSVGSADLQTNAVTTTKINANAVTLAKANADLYTTATFTITGTGFSSDPTATAEYVLIGDRLVVLEIPLLSGTSDAATFTLTGMPAAIVHDSLTFHPATVMDNGGVVVDGGLRLNANGTIDLYQGAQNFSWTTSGTKKLFGCVITYLNDS